jgi:hypothetical protein
MSIELPKQTLLLRYTSRESKETLKKNRSVGKLWKSSSRKRKNSSKKLLKRGKNHSPAVILYRKWLKIPQRRKAIGDQRLRRSSKRELVSS